MSLLRCVLCGNLPPWGLFGKHEELENLASYLISDQSEFINGEFITMDGGALLQGAGSFNMGDSLTDEQWKRSSRRKHNSS